MCLRYYDLYTAIFNRLLIYIKMVPCRSLVLKVEISFFLRITFLSQLRERLNKKKTRLWVILDDVLVTSVIKIGIFEQTRCKFNLLRASLVER